MEVLEIILVLIMLISYPIFMFSNFYFFIFYFINSVILQSMSKNRLREQSHYFLLGSIGILSTTLVLSWTTTKVKCFF